MEMKSLVIPASKPTVLLRAFIGNLRECGRRHIVRRQLTCDQQNSKNHRTLARILGRNDRRKAVGDWTQKKAALYAPVQRELRN